MKRLLLFIALVSVAHAAGSVQQNIQNVGSNVFAFSFYWTGDSVNGSVPATTALGSVNLQGYRVISIETTPGSPAPTNGYSITLIDNAGVDIMAGAATALSSSSPQSFAGSPTAPPLYGSFVFTVTGNAVASAKGSAVVYLAPLSQVLGLSPSAPNFPAQGANLVFASPNGASGSPGFRAVAVPGDFGTNVQGNGSKVQLSTGTTTSGDCAKYDANGNTIDAGFPCANVPAGTQTQMLRLQPNTGNNTTLQFTNRPYVTVTDFVFPFYSCTVALVCTQGGVSAGNLAIGNNTLTVNPVPLGMNGTDAGHYVYISGGTGAAEACLINGGSGTSGQVSGGTIQINCANTHTGAWTMQTATAGIQEAITFGTAGNTEQEVYIPSGTYNLFQQITVPNLTAPKIRGAGQVSTFLIQNNPAASIIVDTCNCVGVTLSDFEYTYTTAANANVNAIVISGGASGTNQHASINNVICQGFNGSSGIVYNCIQLFNVQYANVNNDLFQFYANYGIFLTGNTAGNGAGDNHIINDTFFAATTSAASLFSDFGMSGMLFAMNKVNHGVNGFQLNVPAASFAGIIQIIGNSFENSTTANINIFTASTSNPAIFDIEIVDNAIDIVSGNPSTWSGVLINGTSTGVISGVRIENNRFAGYTPRSTVLAGIQFGGAGTLIDTSLIANNEFSVLDYPVFISSASTNISVVKNQTSNAVVNQTQIGTASVIVDLIQSVLFGALNTAGQLGAAANGSRLYCSDCNAFGTGGSSSGQAMVRVNGVWIPSNPPLIPMVYNTNSNASGAITITAAQITGGSIEVDLGLTGAQAAPQNATLPTVAALLAVITNAQANQTYKIRIINVGTTQTATVTTNTGWTLNGTMTVATNTWRDFVLTITSVGSATATLQSVGTGTQS